MTREELDRRMEWVIPEKESSDNVLNESGEHFVVVNLNHDSYGLGFYIPGDVPRTCNSVKSAAEQVLAMIYEYDHNIESARVFKLVPVPLNEVADCIRDLVDPKNAYIELEDEY